MEETGVYLSSLPITSENFLLYFIAFTVAFFLLGFIIGYILNPSRRSRKTKEQSLAKDAKKEQDITHFTDQNTPANMADPARRMDNRYQRNGYSYSRWDYSRPTRRY